MKAIKDISRFGIVTMLARRYNLRTLLELRVGAALPTAEWDDRWFGNITALDTLSDESLTEDFRVDLVFVDANEPSDDFIGALERGWAHLRYGGILVCHGGELLASKFSILRSLLDFSVDIPDFYTVASDGGCIVFRHKGAAEPADDGTSALRLLWRIVHAEGTARTQEFLSANIDKLFDIVSIGEFIRREKLLSVAKDWLRPDGERTSSNKTAFTRPWLSARPWIDRDDADVRSYVASLETQAGYDLASKLLQWRDLGFVTFNGAIPTATIDELLDDIAAFKKQYTNYNIPIEVRGQQMDSTALSAFPEGETGVKINHLHCFSRAAAKLSLSSEVCDFLGHVFRGPPSVMQSLAFWRGSEQPIHVDFPYVKAQRRLGFLAAAWIPLEDVSPDAGPLGYYPGGHKTSVSGFFDWGGSSIVHSRDSRRSPLEFAEFLSNAMRRAGIERTDFCPKRGDVFVWHGNLPHEGTPVRDRALTRKSYVTHYTSLPDMPDFLLPLAGHEEECEIELHGGFSFVEPQFVGRQRLPSWHSQS